MRARGDGKQCGRQCGGNTARVADRALMGLCESAEQLPTKRLTDDIGRTVLDYGTYSPAVIPVDDPPMRRRRESPFDVLAELLIGLLLPVGFPEQRVKADVRNAQDCRESRADRGLDSHRKVSWSVGGVSVDFPCLHLHYACRMRKTNSPALGVTYHSSRQRGLGIFPARRRAMEAPWAFWMKTVSHS